MLRRKFYSALKLLGSNHPITQITSKIRENWREWILSRHSDRAFFYKHAYGFRYLVLPGVRETQEAYVRGQYYEETEASIIKAWMNPGDFAIDCGANVGLFSTLLANCVGGSGLVWALEASPETCRRLSRVVQTLGFRQIRIINKCVADKEGEAIFQTDSSMSERNSIRQFAGDEEHASGPLVPCVRLDSLLDGVRTPAMVKLDIEGAEPMALRGGRKLFQTANLPLLVFEIYPGGLKRLGHTAADVFRELPDDGYDYWHINFSWPNCSPEFPRGVAFPLRNYSTHQWPTHSNVVAVPRRGVFAMRKERLCELLPLITSAKNA